MFLLFRLLERPSFAFISDTLRDNKTHYGIVWEHVIYIHVFCLPHMYFHMKSFLCSLTHVTEMRNA